MQQVKQKIKKCKATGKIRNLALIAIRFRLNKRKILNPAFILKGARFFVVRPRSPPAINTSTPAMKWCHFQMNSGMMGCKVIHPGVASRAQLAFVLLLLMYRSLMSFDIIASGKVFTTRCALVSFFTLQKLK